jgi:hypothetical protein
MIRPYPEHPYPLGALEYSIENPRAARKLGKRAMLDVPESYLLYDIPRILCGGNIANLGHSRGGSAFLMAHSLKIHDLPGGVLSVDAYGPMPTADGKGVLNATPKTAERCVRECERRNAATDFFGLGHRVDLRRMTTTALGEQCRANGDTFRFVFIDADHSYAGVLGDFKLWSPMIEVGGFVGFHDTNQEFTHRVLEEELFGNTEWLERTELHVSRIRVFERETK